MPMYEYFCSICNKNYPRFRSHEHRRDAIGCPECGRQMNFVEFPQDSVKSEGREDVKDVFRKV